MHKALVAIPILAIAFVLGAVVPASASVSVVPSKVEQQVHPGQVTTFSITFENDSNGAYSVSATPWDFARDAHGNAQPITSADSATFRGCANWIRTPIASAPASPGKSVGLPIEVSVPQDAGPGSYHAYVRFLAAPPANASGTLGVAYAINALVVLTVVPDGGVAGGASVDTQLLRRSVSVGSLLVPGPAMSGVVPLKATLINDGNVHSDVTPRFEILGAGGRVIATIPLREFTLLPGDRYPISATWSKPPLLGNYTARLVMKQVDGKTLTKETSFWIVSWTAIYIAIGGLVALGVLAFLIKKFVHIEIRKADPVPATT